MVHLGINLPKVDEQQKLKFGESSDFPHMKDGVNFVEGSNEYSALAHFQELEAVGADLQKIDLWGLCLIRHMVELDEVVHDVLWEVCSCGAHTMEELSG